ADMGDPNSDDEVMRQDNLVAAVVAYFPPVDLRRLAGPGSWSERFPALNFDPDKAASISPILHADPDDPPTLLIHGDADGLVDIENSVIMHEEFQKKNVESQFITIPGGGHGFQGEDAQRADSARLEWFKKHLL
nr:prolyl oligopeptidase family serine peptidase [Pseudomonadales bacterium]